MLFTNVTELIVLLIVCAVAAVCFVAALVLLIWALRNQKRKQKGERELMGIEADATAAKREFAVGEEFSCDGLIVNAEYNLDPTTQPLDFKVVTADELARIVEAGTTIDCYVIKPNTEKAGDDIVIIKYMDKATCYAITVADPSNAPVQEPIQEEPVQEELVEEEPAQEEVLPVDEPVEEVVEEPIEEPIAESVEEVVEEESQEEPIEEEPQEIIVKKREPIVIEEESFEGVLRYDKSFTAKYIQSRDEVKMWYTTLKNELLSYKKVKARMSWKRETFRMGKEVVARLGYRGNTLCIYLPLNPADYAESKYKVQDVSENVSYADTPCMYRLKNERRIGYAIELFTAVMERMGATRTERIAEDYYLPYEGIVELIGKGLAKRNVQKRSGQNFVQIRVAEAAATDISSSDEPAEKQEQAEEVIEAADKVTEDVAAEEDQSEEIVPVEEQTEETPAQEDISAIDETPEQEDITEESAESEKEAIDDTVEIADVDENVSVSDQPTKQYHGNGKRRKRHKRRR